MPAKPPNSTPQPGTPITGRRGLHFLNPYLGGVFTASGKGPMGAYTCTRHIAPVLDGKFAQMAVEWRVGRRPPYTELALFGVDAADKTVRFWSFTSDGKQAVGTRVEARELPEDAGKDAAVFEAHMPAGLARFLFMPQGPDAFVFAVESANKGGWKRFLEQHFSRDG